MINSDLIQTLVIDRPNLRMDNREKILGGHLLWRPTELQKTRFLNVFEIFSPKLVYGKKSLLTMLDLINILNDIAIYPSELIEEYSKSVKGFSMIENPMKEKIQAHMMICALVCNLEMKSIDEVDRVFETLIEKRHSKLISHSEVVYPSSIDHPSTSHSSKSMENGNPHWG